MPQRATFWPASIQQQLYSWEILCVYRVEVLYLISCWNKMNKATFTSSALNLDKTQDGQLQAEMVHLCASVCTSSMYELIFKNIPSSIYALYTSKQRYRCGFNSPHIFYALLSQRHHDIHVFHAPVSPPFCTCSNGRNLLSITVHTHNWKRIDANQFYILHTFSFVSALSILQKTLHQSHLSVST